MRGMRFMIDNSYSMDVVDDSDSDSAPPSSPPPQSNEEQHTPTPNNYGNEDMKLTAAEQLLSQLSFAEEKKSENSNFVASSNDNAVLGDESTNIEREDHLSAPQQLQDVTASNINDAAAAAITSQPSNSLHEEDQLPASSPIINDSSTVQQAAKSTMAMVKLRVWDPAAPSKQFKFITATTVLLSQDNNSSDPSDNDQSLNDGNTNTSPKKYLDYRSKLKRLSVVKEERRTPSGNIFEDDETTERRASSVTIYEDEDETTDNTIPGLYRLDEETESNDNNNDGDQLLVGNLVGIHLMKNTLTSTSSVTSGRLNSSRQQQKEWKVGNSIRVLHNLNLIPIHTTGLERLLGQIEGNHPSLRELILDGITTTASLSPSSQQQQPLSTSQMATLIQAIGKNTSIKKCSLQHSQINDEIASMFAMALIHNTTMTSLSLRGNNLTSSSIQNFYMILQRGDNTTLRVLDISENVGVEEDVSEAFESFMEQRAVKRMVTMKAERAKRMARGLPLLSDGEEEEEDGRIGSGEKSTRESDNGGDSCCGITVICHPHIIDGTFQENDATHPLHFSTSTGLSSGSFPQSVGGSGPKAGGEDRRLFYDSVSSDITGIGYDAAFGGAGLTAAQQQQQQQRSSPLSMGSGLCPQPPNQHQPQEEQGRPMPMSRPSSHIDLNYSMTPSQVSSNDSSSTSDNITANESLDQRQRQQLATVANYTNRRGTYNSSSRPSNASTSQFSTTSSRTSLNLSTEDYFDDKAGERELRRQLATQGQAIGAFAMDEEAPDRQQRNSRGGRARMSRTESQRRARLSELSRTNGGGGASAAGATGGGALNTVAVEGGGGDIVDAEIEGMEEYEYRNLSLYQKAFSKMGLGGEDKKTERVICLSFSCCILVLLVAIILYVARG